MTYSVPFSANDLRRIADQMDRFTDILLAGGSYAEDDLTVHIAITRPDFGDAIIGHIVCEDGWLGFQPVEDL